MKIGNGLLEHMVIRRNSDGVSEQPFTGKCRGRGAVRVTIFSADGKILRGMNGRICGEASEGTFSGMLKGLKAGGPYRITLSVGTESVTVNDILVGDVWVLGGQSNMQGYGNLENAFPNSSPMVRAYYMTDRWDCAKEPIHCPETACAPVHWHLKGNSRPLPRNWKSPLKKGVGPGVSFANEMFRLTGVPQGVICCAHGGTTMEQWDPARKKEGDCSLYGAMLRRVNRNGGLVSGVIWYQGCSDATNESVPLFRSRMIRFVRSLRRDFHFPEMPFVQVQIARRINRTEDTDKNWTAIREIQRILPHQLRNAVTVPAIDLELDDEIHLSGESQILLGRRLAEAAYTLCGGKHALPPPIEFDFIRMKHVPGRNETQYIISFRNVVGKLTASARPAGFMCNGSLNDPAFRTELAGNTAILHCSYGSLINNLGYGCGTNPYCNILDEAGRSLPAFAWSAIVRHCFQTPFTTRMQVSDPMFGTEELEKISYADAEKQTYRLYPQQTFVIPPDHAKYADKTGVRFFRSRFETPERMPLRLLLGYDGPVRIFVDGKAVYMDPAGTNPVIPGQYHLDVTWDKGRHEVIFVLALHHGSAWGVSLAIARTDIRPTKRNCSQNIPLPLETE